MILNIAHAAKICACTSSSCNIVTAILEPTGVSAQSCTPQPCAAFAFWIAAHRWLYICAGCLASIAVPQDIMEAATKPAPPIAQLRLLSMLEFMSGTYLMPPKAPPKSQVKPEP